MSEQLPEALKGLTRFDPCRRRPGEMDPEFDGEWVRLTDVAAVLSDQEGKLDGPEAMVRAFHERFGLPIGGGPELPNEDERELRKRLLAEEYREYEEGEGTSDLIAIADALGDMVSVIYGTALSYGINLEAVLAEIARSNATKTRDPEKQYPSKNIVKGPDFSPPNVVVALASTPDQEGDCERCHGKGRRIVCFDSGADIERDEASCPDCHGTGKKPRCIECGHPLGQHHGPGCATGDSTKIGSSVVRRLVNTDDCKPRADQDGED